MAGGTKKQIQAADVEPSFPYSDLVTHPAWAVIDAAISSMESNDDLALHTARRYVVGFLVRQLIEGRAIPPSFPSDMTAQQMKQFSWQLVYDVPPVSRRSRRELIGR